jgi:hypothetical protein
VVPAEKVAGDARHLSLGYYEQEAYTLKVESPRIGLVEVRGEVPGTGPASWKVDLSIPAARQR